MHTASINIPRNFPAEISRWLQEHRFTHFITLTTHDPMISAEVMRDRLKQWDARVNRALYGPKWCQHRDQLIWFFAFLENPDSNPHWHLLLRIDDSPIAGKCVTSNQLDNTIQSVWAKLAPAGTIDIKELSGKIDTQLANYVGKQLKYMRQYYSFITPDEFR